ncbi:MAG: hypothetical protein LBG13_03635 [Holosporales bacterium]|jgi:hypothetical protein|nr:hypothetical protein [Holosporales bacterium]
MKNNYRSWLVIVLGGGLIAGSANCSDSDDDDDVYQDGETYISDDDQLRESEYAENGGSEWDLSDSEANEQVPNGYCIFGPEDVKEVLKEGYNYFGQGEIVNKALEEALKSPDLDPNSPGLDPNSMAIRGCLKVKEHGIYVGDGGTLTYREASALAYVIKDILILMRKEADVYYKYDAIVECYGKEYANTMGMMQCNNAIDRLKLMFSLPPDNVIAAAKSKGKVIGVEVQDPSKKRFSEKFYGYGKYPRSYDPYEYWPGDYDTSKKYL